MFDDQHLDHVKFVFVWRSPGPGHNTPWIWQDGTEGIELLQAVQDVYLDESVTVA